MAVANRLRASRTSAGEIRSRRMRPERRIVLSQRFRRCTLPIMALTYRTLDRLRAMLTFHLGCLREEGKNWLLTTY